MNKKATQIITLLLIASATFFTFCSDQYENHSLAFRNNTNDSIQIDRYTSASIRPRTTMVASGQYGKFYETSADMWVSPQVELEKICDSIVVTGMVNDKNFRIRFMPDDTQNYCTSPYSANAVWDLEVVVNEYPRFLGKTLERFNNHIFDINPACITTE
ncbi:MAG: hypothetical protein PHE56_05635 [Bacteroidales bacterium]|nr:hypothetical protein [Bacteroidales bacterium]